MGLGGPVKAATKLAEEREAAGDGERLRAIETLIVLIEGPKPKRRKILREGFKWVGGTFAAGAIISAIAAAGEIWSIGFGRALRVFGWWWLYIPLGFASVGPAVWLFAFGIELVILLLLLPLTLLSESRRAA